MKTASFPSLRVTPDLRAAAEAALEQGETLSSFVETSIRRQIDLRRNRKEFIARGLAAREQVRLGAAVYPVEEVMDSLGQILDSARQRQSS